MVTDGYQYVFRFHRRKNVNGELYIVGGKKGGVSYYNLYEALGSKKGMDELTEKLKNIGFDYMNMTRERYISLENIIEKKELSEKQIDAIKDFCDVFGLIIEDNTIDEKWQAKNLEYINAVFAKDIPSFEKKWEGDGGAKVPVGNNNNYSMVARVYDYKDAKNKKVEGLASTLLYMSRLMNIVLVEVRDGNDAWLLWIDRWLEGVHPHIYWDFSNKNQYTFYLKCYNFKQAFALNMLYTTTEQKFVLCRNCKKLFKSEEKNVSSLFTMGSILDWQFLLASLKVNRTTSEERIWCFLNQRCKEQIGNWTPGSQIDDSLKLSIIKGFNEILGKVEFFDSGTFKGLKMTEEGKKLFEEGLENLHKSNLQRFNRLIFESVYPHQIAKNQKNKKYNLRAERRKYCSEECSNRYHKNKSEQKRKAKRSDAE